MLKRKVKAVSTETVYPDIARIEIAGFTLIEMSIVLVIIGLIVGGIVAGQALIKSASISKVASELQRFQAAVATFRGKYDCLPGDCANATTFFGTGTGGNGCYSAAAPNNNGNGLTSGTCNGNGDGTINAWGSYGPTEAAFAWQQLGLAALIPGQYPGGWQLGSNVLPGTDMPSSAYNSNVGYHLFTEVANVPGWGWTATWSTVIQIGSIPTVSPDFLWGPGLTAPDAYALDLKIDDGNPNGGSITAVNAVSTSSYSTHTNCISGQTYVQSQTSGCLVYFALKIE